MENKRLRVRAPPLATAFNTIGGTLLEITEVKTKEQGEEIVRSGAREDKSALLLFTKVWLFGENFVRTLEAHGLSLDDSHGTVWDFIHREIALFQPPSFRRSMDGLYHLVLLPSNNTCFDWSVSALQYKNAPKRKGLKEHRSSMTLEEGVEATAMRHQQHPLVRKCGVAGELRVVYRKVRRLLSTGDQQEAIEYLLYAQTTVCFRREDLVDRKKPLCVALGKPVNYYFPECDGPVLMHAELDERLGGYMEFEVGKTGCERAHNGAVKKVEEQVDGVPLIKYVPVLGDGDE